ncbi:triphosphoribosyl-dephospho-CoA synthase [Paraburkholderia caballeronis]|uniref:Probable 2-(5''-triphosphoribosyl)-3'-dephosphocoenzyme-A synthase n=1 Tax=Paraburkholderia caballeronis TaxID=416943 RepID=A0A1H7UIR0_9BURK|nr:triphosphoribosyl-dephospho-CoA synthase [Paraburkholderia caballeronis]PXW17485.1 triphosphoribosyl-dephospho-CoA synthase [Paraburkholderia caballeronis]PXW95074.1 triphosphoribosyl-dephospho-CoA synthase [Paraburkholderia caballeronis]RAJ90920.1 triphosphoribosyl-dephospho-CoA synthase [Paraburkholderia caballeronis]SEE17580.1 triphosphoribosyl-dephospho-CoA synthase [Paraburkholderia caballeronis]SEL96922.1 triphosphoribosyl-dephospho-CoA synthase [Paraburkholderia caballeronis]
MRTHHGYPAATGDAAHGGIGPFAPDAAPLPPFATLAPDAWLARFAHDALVDEARLTPKPALVDARGSGAHRDLDLATMLRSAHALEPTFAALARSARGARPGIALRTELARIGRAGEAAMLHATNGSNAHRGAIWIVGLLVAGAAICDASPSADAHTDAERICTTGAQIARHDDLRATPIDSHGERVRVQYNVGGARREAQDGFPHVLHIGLPALHEARANGHDESIARIDALLAIIASLDDTCLLHRAGLAGRDAAQQGARRVRALGGVATRAGRAAFDALERALLALNASPGGAADLLAATLFIDRLLQHRTRGRTASWNN